MKNERPVQKCKHSTWNIWAAKVQPHKSRPK